MKPLKTFTSLLILISTTFITITLLLIPLWADIRVFLGTNLPVMLIAAVYGAGCLGYAIFRWFIPRSSRSWIDALVFSLTGLSMLALLFILLTELGTERAIIWRNAREYLPTAVFFTTAGMLFIFGPQKRSTRGLLVGSFALIGLIWVSLPWQVRIESQPIALVTGERLSVVWGTNMSAASRIDFGLSDALDSTTAMQNGGLRTISDGIQQVSIQWNLTDDLFLRGYSQGVRSIFPTSALTTGNDESNISQIPFPAAGEEISFIAFSDLHEQYGLAAELAANLDWEGIDYAFYVGDVLNNTTDPDQITESFLNLPTGDQNLPRVFVRGNHETRGSAARNLDDWLLPEGQEWYFTFSSGGVFFIVLDSGEDKADDHAEYSGLVDFSTYHQEQAGWLAEVVSSPEYTQAAYRIVLVHHPPFAEPTEEFSPVIDILSEQDQIDLVISGHIHQSGIWSVDDTGLPFPVVTCGGSSRDNMAAVRVDVGQDGLAVAIFGLNGEQLAQTTVP